MPNVQNIAKEFEYVTNAPVRDHPLYGYIELTRKSSVLDVMSLPLLDSVFVLTLESVWGTTGGIGKAVALYQVSKGQCNEIERRIITHQFDRKKDDLANWNIKKIHIGIDHQVCVEFPSIWVDGHPTGPVLFGRTLCIWICMADVPRWWSPAHSHGLPPGCYLRGSYRESEHERPYRNEVMIEESVQILPGALTKKAFRRILQNWNLLDFPQYKRTEPIVFRFYGNDR